jgi:hypothetical protein
MKFLLPILLIASTASADEFVARVIFSEAGPNCTAAERVYVASVIKNRIGHKGFGKKQSMLDVVKVKNAFECINHDANQNWKISGEVMKHWDNVHIRKAWRQSAALAKGKFTSTKNIHFFLTKGTKVPNNFVAKKYWILKKEFSTKHFDFYSIKERK